MYNNWYQLKSNKAKRDPIVIQDCDNFEWESNNNMSDSYNVVTIKLASSKYNFYLWSEKTVKTAKKLYEDKNFKKSLNMLKKYSFEVNKMDQK